MTRRFEVGPILVALGALLLLVSLFLDWYGSLEAFGGALNAWEAFEVVELLLAALAVAAIVVAAGQLVPGLDIGDRRWLPALAVAVAVLVAAAILNPPPGAADATLEQGVWLAFAAALIMIAGAVLTVGRISFAIAVEGRELRERVAVLDHRQDTTETAAVPVEEERSKRLLDDEPPERRAEG